MIFGFFRRKKKEEEKLEEIGEVTHYFPHVKAGVIKIEKGSLNIGDVIKIKGHTTDFKQKITSLQVNHKPIQKATEGKEIGLKVSKRIRAGDKIYKI